MLRIKDKWNLRLIAYATRLSSMYYKVYPHWSAGLIHKIMDCQEGDNQFSLQVCFLIDYLVPSSAKHSATEIHT